MEALSLSELFSMSAKSFTSLIEEETQQIADDKLSEAIEMTESAIERVRTQALFSAGETIEEHPTSSIKVKS